MNKKNGVLIFSLILAFSLASCTGEPKNVPDTPSPTAEAPMPVPPVPVAPIEPENPPVAEPEAPPPPVPAATPEPTPSKYTLPLEVKTGLFDYSKGRLKNIRLACKKINGMRLEPGETFSFNGVVGRRTVERGFKKAYIFKGDEKVKEVGGGICQISSTLHLAALESGLEVVERHQHSQEVDYIELGKDATVYYGSLDFKFLNSSDVPIIISTALKDDGVVVRFDIAE